MAIIKNGRINIWSAVKKQFEVVHPETETARITDFADGIVQKLALTSAMTAVTALQTDSWFGKLLKMALTASGVRYNIAQNGYICFGSFFGGLIIQWGIEARIAGYSKASVALPLTVSKMQVVPVFCPEATNADGRTAAISGYGFGNCIEINMSGSALSFRWIALCHN